jgi:hypothetical protein
MEPARLNHRMNFEPSDPTDFFSFLGSSYAFINVVGGSSRDIHWKACNLGNVDQEMNERPQKICPIGRASDVD